MTFEMTEEMRIKIKTLLIKHEGFKNHLYKDSKGKWTIGIGHNVDDLGIKDQFILSIFYDDVDDHMKFLTSFDWYLELDENRKCALFDMAFNLGDKNFEKFEQMIEALKEKDFERAAQEILNSQYAKELPDRAHDISTIIQTGIL